jgi:predicted GNAT family N-acyltransferase
MADRPVIRPVQSAAEYQAALRVRIAVFVTEQGGPLSDEPDAWDQAARQFVVIVDGEVVGAARVYAPEPGTTKLGRICLLPEYRSRGWGALLLRTLLQYAESLGSPRIILDAQTYALPFYERFGFQPLGEEFLDGGIPHQRMVFATAQPDPRSLEA